MITDLKSNHLILQKTKMGTYTIPNYNKYTYLLVYTNDWGWVDYKVVPVPSNCTFLMWANTETAYRIVINNGTIAVSYEKQSSVGTNFMGIAVYGIILK